MSEAIQDTGSPELDPLLEYLRTARGFDFSGYKRPTLERRIRKRMHELSISSYENYTEYLEVNPREFTELFNTILINVTSFFRDKPAWDYLADEIVPDLLQAVPADGPIRVWSAGCASGEEAYTVAIVLLEALGEEEFKQRVKIYATDVDDEALGEARAAIYPARSFEEVPDELVERYFVENGRGFSFRPDLRRSVIFGRNELIEDAPISRIDLLLCRNVLMYFTPEAQSRILSQLNFALRDHGFLFLGKSEMLIRHADFFTPVGHKWRVFRPVPRGDLRSRLFDGGHLPGADAASQHRIDLREAAAAIGPEARLVIDASRFLVDANQSARAMFKIGPADIGRPIQDLELSYRPLELRSPLDRVFEHSQPVNAGRIDWDADGKRQVFEVEVSPVAGASTAPLGALIVFRDVTEYAQLMAEHVNSRRELETAYEELQSTVEELETTNEELQSTNEELETTNEELQSANEELQTMNEELTSSNDELEVMNNEQREYTRELDRLNLFLEGILGNLGVGVTVVDRELEVQLWNASSEELWGLRPDEVEGRNVLELDIGLPVEQLREPLAAALGDEGESASLRIPAVNRRGRSFECAVGVMPLVSRTDGLFGAVVLMRDAADSGGL